MNFFEHQDQTRRLTRVLILLFIIGIAGIVVSVYAAVSAIFFYGEAQPTAGGFAWLDLHRFLWVGLATLGLILGASLLKILSLRGGGSCVAESLGGRLVDPSTNDPDERRLQNVVEEMAIAAGVPVPVVYIMDDEPGINAFAAGYTQDDAVIGVTRGCLEKLDRDELQGVVAHEFSHILNGDMRLNIHLIGLISGILVLTVLGRIIMQTTRVGRGRGKGGSAIVMMGLALVVIGFIGTLVSRLIQSAVSRQREYLSDASAVQFTRNPSGIAGALKKIGGFATGSAISSPRAVEAGHMFFGNAGSALFSTHPPIEKRIRRLDPSFHADVAAASAGSRGSTRKAPPGASSMQAVVAGEAAGSGRSSPLQYPSPGAIMGSIGTVQPENISFSAEVLAAIPRDVREDLQDPFGASCVIRALLLDADPAEKESQLAALESAASREILERTVRLSQSIARIAPEVKLPLLDLAIPALRRMSPEQYKRFKAHVTILVEADKRISLFEFAVWQIVTHRLDVAFHPRERKEKYKSIEPLKKDAATILSRLAVAGHANPDEAAGAFHAAVKQLRIAGESAAALEFAGETGLPDVGRAIDRFAQARPGVKRVLLDACAHCVLYDQMVTVSEGELFRAVAYALDLPVPPFLVNASSCNRADTPPS